MCAHTVYKQAIHIKNRLEKQAVDKNLISPKKNSTFWGREIRPLFLNQFHGSSSEDDDEDEEEMVRRGKELRKKQRREKRAEKALMNLKLAASPD